MIITLHPGADLDAARRALVELGLWLGPATRLESTGTTLFTVAESSTAVALHRVREVPGVWAAFG